MGRIEKFLALAQEVEIAGEKYMIKPFTVGDMALLNKMGSKDIEEQSKAIREAVFKVVKQIDSEATQEQADNLSIQYLNEIMEAIAKVNSVDIEEAKKTALEKIKSIQEVKN